MVIKEPIDVILICSSTKHTVRIFKVKWRNREYTLKELCAHYVQEIKGIQYHFYHIVAGNLSMQLMCNPLTFHWELREVTDLDETV